MTRTIENMPFQPEQIEKLKELGSRLRDVRERQVLSLREVSERTRISPRLLAAIEEADAKTLPESVYLKGLLKRYADALGLKGSEWAAEFPLGNILAGITPSWQSIPTSRNRSLHLYCLYVLTLMVGISSLSHLSQRSPLQANDPNAEQAVAIAELPETASPVTTKLPKTTSPLIVQPSRLAKPVVVDVTLKDNCWIRIVADGKTTFEGTLQKGDRRTWEANEELVIRAGNAGGVEIAFNEQQAEPLGKLGQVETVTYQAPPQS